MQKDLYISSSLGGGGGRTKTVFPQFMDSKGLKTVYHSKYLGINYVDRRLQKSSHIQSQTSTICLGNVPLLPVPPWNPFSLTGQTLHNTTFVFFLWKLPA